MTYPDSVRFLYSLGNELKAGAKWNLARMHTLLDALGHPERGQRFVHVAGTNGKGSTAAMISSALRESKQRTGLFTSPHLIEPTERIQIDGRPISDHEFSAAFDAVHAAAEKLERESRIDGHPSYFETVTAMALLVFSGRVYSPACDISVIEVGLGGRLDATNVIVPQVSVITPISFDHESFLGNTIEAIAGEKAGIIKSGVPVVMAKQSVAAESIVRSHARAAEAPLIAVDENAIARPSFTPRYCTFELEGLEYRCGLAGRHQLQNALTAIIACGHLGLSTDAIQRGLANVQWPGRLEYISSHPDFVLDGAHNPEGAQALSRYIREFCSQRPVWLVYGTMRDKAIDEVIEPLFSLADRLILTAPSFPRALRPEAIAEMIARSDAVITENVEAAVALAEHAPPGAIVFFTGSLYLVGDVRAVLLRKMKGIPVSEPITVQ